MTENSSFIQDGDRYSNGGDQAATLGFLFPGYSVIVQTVRQYLGIDLSLYIPFILVLGVTGFAWAYVGEHIENLVKTCLMSTAEIRPDDEIYVSSSFPESASTRRLPMAENVVMSWVAGQSFGYNSRHFIVNLDLNSSVWSPWAWNDDFEDNEAQSKEERSHSKSLSYTPSFGTHLFWYKGRLILFRRSKGDQQPMSLTHIKREEISLRCFGHSPSILKDLLNEAHEEYLRMDDNKTMIYRANLQPRSEPSWQRCMAREPRRFSTIITRPGLKESVIDDITDYLSPETRMWYNDCGIPWRRGYLFAGPPGTGKSSFSFALAGHFKLRIYTVSLSSANASEENLATLFSQLPQVCVVLFEDIDAAGLASTRSGNPKGRGGRKSGSNLSLSGLLNLLDGVASQEGRILIMSTNHVEHLDKALIRPGRVDMTIRFTPADGHITAAIFRAVFASRRKADNSDKKSRADPKSREVSARIEELSAQFAAKIPPGEFSPAEVQGYLIRHKRQPEVAVSGAEGWVITARLEKAASEAARIERAEETGEESVDEEDSEDDGSDV